VTNPLTVFAILEISEVDMAHVQGAVSELARQSISEPGCIRYDVFHSLKEPVRLIIHEVWTDDSAIEVHRRSLHMAEFKAALNRTTARLWASQCQLLD